MPEDRRIKKTKKAIKDALITLMKDRPVNCISVTELTRTADISRKTFYLHYNSIFDAKNDVDNDIIMLLEEVIAPLPASPDENDIMQFLTLVHKRASEHAYLVDYFVRNSNQSTLYVKVKDTLKRSLLDRLESEHKGSVQNEYIVEYVISGILSIFLDWNKKRDLSVEGFVALLAELCTDNYSLIAQTRA